MTALQNGSWLTFADRRKGGLANWDAHHRIPPGRKALPRLKAPSEESAGTPRGGYQQVRRGRLDREVPETEFDFIS